MYQLPKQPGLYMISGVPKHLRSSVGAIPTNIKNYDTIIDPEINMASLIDNPIASTTTETDTNTDNDMTGNFLTDLWQNNKPLVIGAALGVGALIYFSTKKGKRSSISGRKKSKTKKRK